VDERDGDAVGEEVTTELEYVLISCMIRIATQTDASEIARIHVAGWRAAYDGIMPSDYLAALSEKQRAEEWRRRLEKDSRLVWLACDETRILGWIAIGKCRDVDLHEAGEVYALYVDPNSWRQGAGRALMNGIAAVLSARDYSQIVLWVLEQNGGGRAFYAKLGYAEDGAKKDISIGEASLREIRMRKVLSSPENQAVICTEHP
jgi:ribosomal protein S18 acetylase RimI-like enzyme